MHKLNFVFQKLGTIQENSTLKLTTNVCIYSNVLGLLLKDVMCYYMFTHSMNNYLLHMTKQFFNRHSINNYFVDMTKQFFNRS